MLTENKVFRSFVPEIVQKEFKSTVAKVSKAYRGLSKLREADRITRHFSNYFNPVIGREPHIAVASARIRHQVFCHELAIFDSNEDGLESDIYDNYAEHCLIQHEKSKNYAGTMRLICPNDTTQDLPISKFAKDFITKQHLHPENFPPEQTLEISRIAIPRHFRRRKGENDIALATGGFDLASYSEIEMRCFPLIAVGLYMASAAYSKISGRKHVYMMIEPKLARSLSHIGIHVERIGKNFEYAGTRAPCYINYDDFILKLKPSFKNMQRIFIRKLI